MIFFINMEPKLNAGRDLARELIRAVGQPRLAVLDQEARQIKLLL